MNRIKQQMDRTEMLRLLSNITKCLTVMVSVMILSLLTSFPCHAADLYPACTTVDLQTKISQANSTSEPDTLHLPANCSYILSDPAVPGVGLLPITTEMTLQGAGPDSTIIRRLTVTGAAMIRILHVTATGRLTLDGVTLRAGYVSGDGGAILSQGSLTVLNSVIEHNHAIGDGGAIKIERDEAAPVDNVVITNSIIRYNTAIGDGGAIKIERDEAAPIYNVVITNSTIRNNSATERAGGIANEAHLSLSNCVLSENAAIATSQGGKDGGGAIRNKAASILDIADCLIEKNTVQTGDGGGIDNQGQMTMTRSTVRGNQTQDDGGGIDCRGESSLDISNSTISYNTAQGDAGGISIEPVCTASIVNSTIAYNRTYQNGGAFNNEGVLTLTNCTVVHNRASLAGAAIENHTDCRVENTILALNSAHSGHFSYAPINSLGHNLIDDLSCYRCTIVPSSTDIVGMNPRLECYTDNGTPGNGHIPLLPQSPGKDMADSSTCPDHDQLGRARTGVCDIGAVENQSLPSYNYRFVVMADSRDKPNNPDGTDGTGVNETRFDDILYSVRNFLSPQPAFILFGGDLILGGGTHSEALRQFDGNYYVPGTYYANAWTRIVDNFLGANYARTKIYPIFAYHEKNSPAAGTPARYWSAFDSIFDPVQYGNLDCTYFDINNYGHTGYYCDYENARFFFLINECSPGPVNPNACIDNEINDAQREWVEDNACRELNFIMHHEPAYGAGAHSTYVIPSAMDGNPVLRDKYIEQIGRRNIAMIFSGHEHQYTRRLVNQEFANLKEIVLLARQKSVNTGPRTTWAFDGSPSKAPLLHIEYQVGTSPIRAIESRIIATHTDTQPPTSNDSEEPGSLNNSDLELVKDGATLQTIGMRWVGLDIPRGAVITNAYIQFTAKEAGSTATDVRFEGEASCSPSTFSTVQPPSSRQHTSAYMDWDQIPAWAVDQSDSSTRTPSIRNIIQEIIDNCGAPDLSFDGEFYEVKTGTCGAPWSVRSLPEFLLNVKAKLTELQPPWSDSNKPYQYAVVDVSDDFIVVNVYAVDGNRNTALIDSFTAPPDMAIPGNLDIDGDGVTDSVEGPYAGNPAAAQIPTATGRGTETIAVPTGKTLQNVTVTNDADLLFDQASKPPGTDFPFGMNSIGINNITPAGGSVDVTITFPANVADNFKYWKYGYVTNCGSLPSGVQWYEMRQLGRAVRDGSDLRRITLTLTDGGCGDSDGLANGQIVDAGGLTIPGRENINASVSFNPLTNTYRTTADTSGCTSDLSPAAGYKGKFSFDAKLTNISAATSLSDLVVVVAELTNNNILRDADGGPSGTGGQLTIPLIGLYSDGILGKRTASTPGESVKVHFDICLTEIKSFRFFVDVMGRKN